MNCEKRFLCIKKTGLGNGGRRRGTPNPVQNVLVQLLYVNCHSRVYTIFAKKYSYCAKIPPAAGFTTVLLPAIEPVNLRPCSLYSVGESAKITSVGKMQQSVRITLITKKRLQKP